ncbi:Nitrogen regulatory protein P-II [compost metagenome]
MKVEIVISSSRKDEVITAISKSARTGAIGDGKIFIHPVLEVVRIRNDDRNESAI